MFGFGKATNSGVKDEDRPKREGEFYADAFSRFVKKQTTKVVSNPTSMGSILIAGGLGLLEPYGRKIID